MTKRVVQAGVVAGAMLIGAGGIAWAGEVAAPESARTSYLATFTVPNPQSGLTEKYHIRLTEADDIDAARAILAGTSPKKIPVGRIVRGSTDVNSGYSWHIDPKDFTFGDYALRICDVPPSAVESGAYRHSHLCPWSAVLVGLQAIPAAR